MHNWRLENHAFKLLVDRSVCNLKNRLFCVFLLTKNGFRSKNKIIIIFLNNAIPIIQIFVEHYFYKVPLKSLKSKQNEEYTDEEE